METPLVKLIGVGDTGPLISVFQSGSLGFLEQIFSEIHTTTTCLIEIRDHGWSDLIGRLEHLLVQQTLDDDELRRASQVASHIAYRSKNKEVSAHLGEAEITVLAQRPSIAADVVLLDEVAARSVASEMNLNVTGFACMLLFAVRRRMLDADEVKRLLEQCRREGTYYSSTFIEQVYERAKKG